jgi:hypothetical protein
MFRGTLLGSTETEQVRKTNCNVLRLSEGDDCFCVQKHSFCTSLKKTKSTGSKGKILMDSFNKPQEPTKGLIDHALSSCWLAEVRVVNGGRLESSLLTCNFHGEEGFTLG